uniref:Uncharacterized protein n=1 Tax=Trichogramma kaykai TaxID=54128 RepID=A0ABD2W849_9HYME
MAWQEQTLHPSTHRISTTSNQSFHSEYYQYSINTRLRKSLCLNPKLSNGLLLSFALSSMRAYRIYKRRRTTEALAAYRLHRRILKNRLDSAKNDYISHELASAASPILYWSVLKRIGVTAKRSPSPLTYFSPETLFFALRVKN